VRQVLAPLRKPAFRRLTVAYTVNQVGDYIGLVALNVLVYEATESAVAVAALLLSMQFLPALAAPILTARIDQAPPARILAVLYALEGALFALLALASQDVLLPLVLTLAFVDGVLMLSARGVVRAAMNRVLEPDGALREGNAIVNLGFALAAVGGAALGGVLVAAFDATTALMVDAVSFLLVAALVATLNPLVPAAKMIHPPAGRLRAGLDYVRRHRALRIILAGEAIAIMLFTLTSPVQVVYAQETLDVGDGGYGAIVAAWGAGVMLGSLLFLRIRRLPATHLILASTLALGLAFLGTGLARELWLACVFSVLGGAGNGIQWVAVLNRLQEAVPDDFQARVVGLLESIGSASMGVGFLIGGLLTAATSPPTAYLLSGGATVALVVAGAITLAGVRRPAPA
jgi:MFS family permease